MGKLEWYFGARSSPSRRATTADDHSRRRHSLPSCMSTLFHFFDFRSSHFTHIVFDNRHSSSFDLSHHHPALRSKASHHGVEAPRNSLELDGDSISCLRNKEEYLQLQMGLQIKTRNGSTKSKASDQKHPNNDHIIALESPSTKTPNLLARLMGLDNFPQTSSSSYYRCGPNLGTRSLPESPRVSSSRLSDVDCHHRRLSLQINQKKENNNIKNCEEIIKQKKKNVGRRQVALVDITNSNNKVGFEIQEIGSSQSRKVEMKSSKKLKKTIANESSSSKVVRRNQKAVMVSKKQKLIPMPMQIPKRSASEREAFDCPTTNNLFLNHSTIFLVKKEASPPATKVVVPREQPCSYPKDKEKPAGGETNAVDTTTTTIDGGSTEFKTIQISNKDNSKWIIPPSTFHHLETTVAAEERRWKKRLVLQMAVVGGDQIPENKSWQVRRGTKRGWEFPRGKCELVAYNDTLINKDLEKSKLIIMAEEREEIVRLVELHILDSLLRETLALIS